jgi:hypothetical protein
VAPGARAPFILLLALGAAPALAAGTARADEPTELASVPHARLVYFVDPTASGCPTAETFRAAVDARAGHELFGEPADLTLDVTIRRLGNAYVATIGLPDAPTAREATRELRSDAGCAELATAAALVASIAIDPTSVLRAPPEPPPPAPPPATPAPRTWRALVGLGPRGVWGLTPDPTFGLALSAAAVSERRELAVEIAGLVADDARYSRGSVSVLPLTLSLLPCALWAHAEACGVARLGILRGAGTGFSDDRSVWKAFGALGARGGLFSDVGPLRIRASVEGTATEPKTAFYVDETTVYTTRGVSVAVGVDALLFF